MKFDKEAKKCTIGNNFATFADFFYESTNLLHTILSIKSENHDNVIKIVSIRRKSIHLYNEEEINVIQIAL